MWIVGVLIALVAAGFGLALTREGFGRMEFDAQGGKLFGYGGLAITVLAALAIVTVVWRH